MAGYDDIINLKYHKSKKRKPMERHMRAAQFAPFSALNGYDFAIYETGRETTKKITLDENQKTEINYKLFFLLENIQNEIITELTYFVPDKTKDGGEYVKINDVIIKYNDFTKTVITKENGEIHIDDILSLDCEIFNTEPEN